MRDYGIVSPNFWIKGTGKELRGDKDAQLVALYLMTSPHSNMIGVYYQPVSYIAEETGCPIEGASKGLLRLVEVEYCDYDHDSQTIFVFRMAAHQVGEALRPGDKRISFLKKEVEKIISPRLKQRFLDIYGQLFHLCSHPVDNTPETKPHRRGIEGASRFAAQDQDQDQEQDQDQDQDQEHEQEQRQDQERNGRQRRNPIAAKVKGIADHMRIAK